MKLRCNHQEIQRSKQSRWWNIPAFLLALLVAAQPLSVAAQSELGVERLAQRGKTYRSELLLTHGINLDVPSMLVFLSNGFPENTLRRGLPDQPEKKTEVANAVVQELGFQQSPEAVALLLSIAKGNRPNGLVDVLDRDTEALPVTTKETAAIYYHNVLRYNALVALGLLGDKSVAEEIHLLLQANPDFSLALEGSVALGLLEDSRALQVLANQMKSAETERLHTAFQAVFFLTGRNYDVSQFSSVGKRREAISQFRTWFAENKSTWQPSREAILRRREAGLVYTVPPLGTIRGALRATKEFGNYDLRYSGRTFLRNKGDAIWEEYQLISLDPLEELDIRVAAMEWYAASSPKNAKKDFKKLEDNDENPEIRDKARSLLDDIEKLLDKK
ncbi:MAG: hypothetical protein ACFCU1_10160 [Sumerlaeia bacterium]